MSRVVEINGKKYTEHELLCPDCNHTMQLQKTRFGIAYKCHDTPGCRGSHGAHPNGSPHGIPADSKTRKARSEAHEVFDRIWKMKFMSRVQAYAWMRSKTGVYHISEMSIEQCRVLITAVYESFPELKLDLESD